MPDAEGRRAFAAGPSGRFGRPVGDERGSQAGTGQRGEPQARCAARFLALPGVSPRLPYPCPITFAYLAAWLLYMYPPAGLWST
jgi:hypothetical protein